jgi:hypothetical protein
MIGETITVSRPGVPTGAYDEQGNAVLSAWTTFEIEGVAPAPGTAAEQTEPYGPRSTNAFTLYRRGDLDLRVNDMVTLRGSSGWQVVGDAVPVDWVNPYTTAAAGSVAEVRRAS